MIKVCVSKDGVNFKKVSILGHAMYADYGKDIVCSAVSSILTTTVNGLIAIDEHSIDYVKNSNSFELDILKHDIITNKLITNMLNLLTQLAKDYPKNIKLNNKEETS